MDTWETIRLRCRRDGEKIKVVARELGLAPNMVRKYLRQDGPPKRAALAIISSSSPPGPFLAHLKSLCNRKEGLFDRASH